VKSPTIRCTKATRANTNVTFVVEKGTPTKSVLRTVTVSASGVVSSQQPDQEDVLLKTMEECGKQLAQETLQSSRQHLKQQAEIEGRFFIPCLFLRRR
jgi:uncharacterized lipoprotein YajG